MLLDALPRTEQRLLDSHLERVRLEHGQTLYWPDVPITHVYFPDDRTPSVVSLVSHGAGGEEVEAGLVGREGMAGLPVFLGAEAAPHRALAQVPGEAWRMPATALREACEESAPLRRVLGRYAQALMTMMGQGVLCNRLHLLGGGAARWLLLVHDRVHGDALPLTHEYIAQMLAVRRPGVTEALSELKEAEAISYHRGTVVVEDRQALEAAACPCYALIAAQYARLAPTTPIILAGVGAERPQNDLGRPSVP